MSEMYENLGDLLNQAIKDESLLKKDNKTENIKHDSAINNIPNTKTDSDDFSPYEKTAKSTKNKIKPDDFLKNSSISTGKIIKLHKYTDFMQFPVDIQNALTTLDIAYPFSIESIKKQYRNLIKKYHPDTVKTENKQEIAIQISENVYKTRQLSINELTSAYKLLIDYFSV